MIDHDEKFQIGNLTVHYSASHYGLVITDGIKTITIDREMQLKHAVAAIRYHFGGVKNWSDVEGPPPWTRLVTESLNAIDRLMGAATNVEAQNDLWDQWHADPSAPAPAD